MARDLEGIRKEEAKTGRRLINDRELRFRKRWVRGKLRSAFGHGAERLSGGHGPMWLKKAGDDLAIIFSERPAVAAAVFTQNLVQAAPVLVSREHLRFKTHRAIVVNSGGANACTGEGGLSDARATAQMVAEYFNCDDREILVASTGVIGVRLDMDKIASGVREATGRLSRKAGFHVAEAIMTTDTRLKRAARSVKLGDRVVKIAGVAKGSGMIHPDMATLLSFVTTDAAVGKGAA